LPVAWLGVNPPEHGWRPAPLPSLQPLTEEIPV